MAKFGEAMKDYHEEAKAAYDAANSGSKKDNEKGNSKGGRKSIDVVFEPEDRPQASFCGFFMSRKELCSSISRVLAATFKDYVGCNFKMLPNGQTVLVGVFGAGCNHEDAKYTAFDQMTKSTASSSIKQFYHNFSQKDTAYFPTEDGIEMLSDLVPAFANQKDKEGKVKNFKQFWTERTDYSYNGYAVMPNTKGTVYAEVVMDINNVLRKTWPKVDYNDAYKYDVTFTPYTNCRDYNDPLLQIVETSRKEANKVLSFVGAIPRNFGIADLDLY